MERHIRSDQMEGVIVERLEYVDEVAHEIRYSIVDGGTRAELPFREYLATVVMTDLDGATQIDWSGRFDVVGVPEDRAERFAAGLYRTMIDSIRREVEEGADATTGEGPGPT